MTELISESMDRDLSLREKLALRLHTMLCGACRRYQKQLNRVRSTMQSVGDAVDDATSDQAQATLSPEARARIAEALPRD